MNELTKKVDTQGLETFKNKLKALGTRLEKKAFTSTIHL